MFRTIIVNPENDRINAKRSAKTQSNERKYSVIEQENLRQKLRKY